MTSKVSGIDETPSISLQGHFPSWLNGTLIRNGPTNITINGKGRGHWLDGLAMLHAFHFSNGQLTYTSRFLRTAAYSQVFDKHSFDYLAFAADPCRSLFKRFFTLFAPYSPFQNANVNVAKIADRYVALTEVPLPIQFDPQTLVTLGVLDFQDNLPHKKSWESAHPHTLYNTNYCIQYGPSSHYILYTLKDTTRHPICRIPVERPAYMHTFAITQNYIILTEFPYTVKPLKTLLNTYFKGEPFIKNFDWHPESGTTFILIHRHTGKLLSRHKTKPFFAFHHANAYEHNDEILLDIVTYDNPNIIQGLANHFISRSTDEDQFPTRLERFILTPDGIESKVLFSHFLEFPRINDLYDGHPYNHLYAIDPRQDTPLTDLRPIYKINTQTGQTLQWSYPNCYPGEPVFVPSPNATQEDDGLILSIVLHKTQSFLLALNAQTLKEVARAPIPHTIPPGLHGQFFST